MSVHAHRPGMRVRRRHHDVLARDVCLVCDQRPHGRRRVPVDADEVARHHGRLRLAVINDDRACVQIVVYTDRA